MKKILIALIVLVLLGVGGWYITHKSSSTPAPVKVEPTVAHPDPSNATFTFEDGPVTLRNGNADTPVTPDGAITQNTTLTDDIAYGDINADGKTDSVVLLVQSGSGSGIFLYVGAYVSGTVQYKGTNTVFIGDRVTPKSISISKTGIISVNFLDRKATEPYAAEPTVLTTKNYVFKSGSLEEK